MNDGEVYRHTEALGEMLARGIEKILREIGITGVVARQGSALCLYFMDHCPKDWHDLAMHNNFEKDTIFRRLLVDRGIYVFPQATKQWSLSAAHSAADVDLTLRQIRFALARTFDAADKRAISNSRQPEPAGVRDGVDS
jgi:glutamate-1-semialdehyde 2,1-aminomutase